MIRKVTRAGSCIPHNIIKPISYKVHSCGWIRSEIENAWKHVIAKALLANYFYDMVRFRVTLYFSVHWKSYAIFIFQYKIKKWLYHVCYKRAVSYSFPKTCGSFSVGHSNAWRRFQKVIYTMFCIKIFITA